jgi:hypothetical protein
VVMWGREVYGYSLESSFQGLSPAPSLLRWSLVFGLWSLGLWVFGLWFLVFGLCDISFFVIFVFGGKQVSYTQKQKLSSNHCN